MAKVMTGVTEYGEGLEVKLYYENERPTIVAYNEGGFNATAVDLIELLDWVYKNEPDLYAPRPAWANLAQLEINPEPRPWVGLTDDAEIFALSNTMPYANRFEFARAIEALLKQRNT